MGQELQLPQAFQNRGMSQAFASQLNAQDDNLADGIGQSYGVIGYKGKVWSGRYRGERKAFLRPDDGTPASYLDVIILGQAKTKSKSYYKQYDPNQSDGDRPICSSMDGVAPDADVTTKQCDSCVLCPRNVWKTDTTTGRKGRECTDYKRLAVLVLPTQTKPTFGQPIMEAMFLRVPPDSLNSLALMGETMTQQGFHYSSYVTRITFDPNKAHPCMVFRPLQPLGDQEATLVLDMRKDPAVNRITGGETTTGAMKPVQQTPPPAATGLVATAQPTPQLQPQPAPATPQPQPAQPAQITGTSTGSGTAASTSSANSGTAAGALPVTPPQNTSVEPLSTGLLDAQHAASNGSGGASTVLASPPLSPEATVSSSQTAGGVVVADSGAPEESDAELDARIASLIAPK